MTNRNLEVTPVRFARVAGVGLLVMVAAAIFSNLVTQNLVVSGNASRTATNIAAQQLLFRIGICGWLVVAALDVVVGLALYVVPKPVNRSLSLLFCCGLARSTFRNSCGTKTHAPSRKVSSVLSIEESPFI